MLLKLLKSKTIVANTLVVLAGTLGYLAGHEVIAAHPDWVAGLVAVAGVVNVVLRLVTTVPVWSK
jgi:hypothetical protein